VTLAGRVALVTGAARNIGAAVAERLAAEGAAVAVNHRAADSAADAEAVVARIRAAGGAAAAFAADVGSEDEVEAMFAAIERELGPIDVVVNNAATSVAADRPWHELTAADWERVQRTNVTGAFLCARAAYPAMRAAGRGDVVSMSSVRALLGLPGNLHYTTTKAALIGFTRALAREVGGENIRVNALIVGAIRTQDEAVYGPPAEIDARVLGLQSLKRRGLPQDVAAVTAFLVGPDAGFVTGQCITVDGGWVMH
jgi:3-oxoacyl-[acyl-carrier protein] reductase